MTPPLWFRIPGIPQRSPVIVSRSLDGKTWYFAIECGQCHKAFVLPAPIAISHDASGAVSTQQSFNCPHCEQWWVRFIAGDVVPGAVRYCPSCEFRMERPSRYGWIQCGVCAWEGRVSETLTEKPVPEPDPDPLPEKDKAA